MERGESKWSALQTNKSVCAIFFIVLKFVVPDHVLFITEPFALIFSCFAWYFEFKKKTFCRIQIVTKTYTPRHCWAK